MAIPTSSREKILQNIRTSIPDVKVEPPRIPAFDRKRDSLRADFEVSLTEAGGLAHDVPSVEAAQAKLAELHPQAKVICSAVTEIAGTRNIKDVTDPHELADVEVGIIRARFAIAEGGAIWVTQEDLGLDALGFLSQHLVVLLDPDQIVADMHEAYRRVRLDQTAFGCFMAGPSATADVEATLVHGAQGARSLNVFLMPPATV